MEYIKVDNLAFHYDDEPVLQNISFTVRSGEFAILTGENGAAKTTLLRNILGLLKPSRGSVSISNKNRWDEKMVVGYVPLTVGSFNIGYTSNVLLLIRYVRYPL